MRTRFLLFLATFSLLFIVVGCSSDGDTANDSSTEANPIENNDDGSEESNPSEDAATEEGFLENLLVEANKYTDRMLQDENFTIGIDRFGNYDMRSYIQELTADDVEIRLTDTQTEIEFVTNEEDYELSNGLKGTLGDVGNNNIVFLHYDDNMRTEIQLGEMEIEDAKEKINALDFMDEALTENDIYKGLGFTYEDVKFFDHTDSDYEVSELWIRKGNINSLEVRYRNHDAGEYDAIDVSVSAEAFEVPDSKVIENITTSEGKEVTIIDDGFFVEWLWEEDDGYFYRIAGNYDEEEVEKKEYNLEVIDKMIKKYGE